MRKALMEGLAVMSGDTVKVVDIPDCVTHPADVKDICEFLSREMLYT